MSRTIEERNVEVIRCDFCGEETKQSDKCVLCGKEGCNKEGGSAHFAFAVGEVYHYKVGMAAPHGTSCGFFIQMLTFLSRRV